MEKTEVLVGRGLDDAIADVAAAWSAVERSELPEPTDRIYIEDWSTLYAVVTPARYALLRHVRRTPTANVAILAEALGREVSGVDADVLALEALGLIERAEDGRLSSDVDEIVSTIRIAA